MIMSIFLELAVPVECISVEKDTINSASALCPNEAVLSMEPERVESRLKLAMVVSPAPCTCCSRCASEKPIKGSLFIVVGAVAVSAGAKPNKGTPPEVSVVRPAPWVRGGVRAALMLTARASVFSPDALLGFHPTTARRCCGGGLDRRRGRGGNRFFSAWCVRVGGVGGVGWVSG